MTFAGESQMDEAAERLGLDPLEIRKRNVLAPGESAWPKARGIDADIAADIDLAAELLAMRPELPGLLISHRYPLDAAVEAFRVANDRKAGAIKVVLEP